MKIAFRITSDLLDQIHKDLSRPHLFAAERVGFIACSAADAPDANLILLAQSFHSVADDHYVNDPRFGALMSSKAIRTALEYAYQHPVSMFHVHRHEHRGRPKFSPIDRRESARFMPDFWKVRRDRPHGTLVLSWDSMTGLCWQTKNSEPEFIASFSIVGRPTKLIQEWP